MTDFYNTWAEAEANGASYDEFERGLVDHYLSPTQQASILQAIGQFSEKGYEFRSHNAWFIAFGTEVDKDSPRYRAILNCLTVMTRDGKVKKNPHSFSFFIPNEAFHRA